MTFNESQQIGERGEHLLPTFFPMGWQIRKQYPDYHKDFYVEIFENKESTGEEFVCTVKTTKHLSTKKSTVATQSVDTKSLRYYVDKARMPVFLILIDLSNQFAYYLFLQQYLLEIHKPWRQKKTLTIEVPLQNVVLSAGSSFRDGVGKAIAFMENRYPGSVKAAIQKNNAFFEAVDPRFRGRTDVINGAQIHTLSASEDVPIKFTFEGPTDRLLEKMDKLVKRGQKVNFAKNEVSFAGTPIFQKLIPEQAEGFEIQMRWEMETQISIIAYVPNGEIVATIEDIPATRGGGTHWIEIVANLKDSPLSVSIQIDLRSSMEENTTRTCPIKIKLDPKAWEGKEVLQLGYFDRIYRLYSALKNGALWRIEVFQSGNLLFGSNLTKQSKPVDKEMNYLDLIKKAREIAKEFGVNPVLPHLTHNHAIEILNLHDLLTMGHWETRTPRFKRICPLSTTDAKALLNSNLALDTILGPVTIKPGYDQVLPFLDSDIVGLRLSYTVSDVRVNNLKGIRRMLLQAPPPETIPVTIVGTKNSITTVNRIT